MISVIHQSHGIGKNEPVVQLEHDEVCAMSDSDSLHDGPQPGLANPFEDMRDMASRWKEMAHDRAATSLVKGIAWKAMNYLSLLATAAGGASGGAALNGSHTFAAVAAFVSAAAAAASTATAAEVTRDRLRKVAWRQVEDQADRFVSVTVRGQVLETVEAAFASLEDSVMKAEVAGVMT